MAYRITTFTSFYNFEYYYRWGDLPVVRAEFKISAIALDQVNIFVQTFAYHWKAGTLRNVSNGKFV